ncbi:LysR family transcriptional regulator [Bosea thiooxidans]|nr:LysR family transcriptional regulator [Bosea sp. (in: a-proteobacteria)]
MSEKRIDLNLMNVLYAVMAEGSVTRAAQRLSMSQPAVSNALRRLRYLLKDELFIKVPGGIRPTEKALEIWPELQSALDRLRAIALPPEFEPARSTLTFNVAITDTLTSRVVPALASRFVREAPLAKLHFHLHSNPGSVTALERGAIDCAVGMFPTAESGLQLEGVLADDYICIFRRGHPDLSNPLTLQQFVAASHVLVKQATWQIGIVDNWLNLAAERRNIVLVVNTSAEAVEVVGDSDLAAAVPKGFAQSLPNLGALELAALPFWHEQILYKMAWHQRTDRDAARAWLRSLMRQTIAQTCAASSPLPV